eukprot:UN26149
MKKMEKRFELNQRLPALESKRLLNALLILRKTCCHPQLSQRVGCRLSQKTMGLEELLDFMITKSQNKCAETLRSVLLQLNALGGLAAIEKSFEEAIQSYDEVLEISQDIENSQTCVVDDYQLMH